MMTHLSIGQLKEAIQIKEQIETLEGRLRQLLGGKAVAVSSGPGKRGPRKVSAEKTRAVKTKEEAVVKTAKKKGGLTTAGRARLSAAMKARWAARKKGGPAPNAPV